ncbi:MAG: type II toxin-antitoxin system prevent-host-death family antitoxin [Treponema sp.]|nr:type II toxin-antitoxin system prevent-host-death family antitoxin [Treponema sp.]MBQ6567598.1 type II toxin-antitoxin system prevent-host-death family antitoxin [Treponema sp.]MBQ7167797.1 type II toxin-antitoxin system prevent-host-death family antitoxin [Treponema sp.]
MCNAVPVFEAKNKLPFFIHQAETEGPVPITRHNQEVAYIVSKSDYDEMRQSASPRKSLVERLQDNRKEFGLEDDDFDLAEFIVSLRDPAEYAGRGSEHIFDDIEVE